MDLFHMKKLLHLHRLHDAWPQAKFSHRLEITDEKGNRHWIVADVCSAVEKSENEDSDIWTVNFVRTKLS